MDVEKDPLKLIYMSSKITEDDEILIERLVDGELSEEERFELIQRLDETVDGWRFCALSFLEDQEFESALRSYSPRAKNNVDKLKSTNIPVAVASREVAHKKLFHVVVSCAVCILVAVVSLSIGRYLIPSRLPIDLMSEVVSFPQPDRTNPAPHYDKMPEDLAVSLPSSSIALPTRTNELSIKAPDEAENYDRANLASKMIADASIAKSPHLNERIASLSPNNSNRGANTFAHDFGGGMGMGMGSATRRETSMGGGSALALYAEDSDESHYLASAAETNDAFLTRKLPSSSSDFSIVRDRMESFDNYEAITKRANNTLALDDSHRDAHISYLNANETEGRIDHTNSLPEPTRQFVIASRASSSAGNSMIETVAPQTNVSVALLNCPAAGFIDVPVSYSENARNESTGLAEIDDALPEEVRQHLNTVGGRVEARRNEYRFPLGDGRTLIVPVDDYTIQHDGDLPVW